MIDEKKEEEEDVLLLQIYTELTAGKPRGYLLYLASTIRDDLERREGGGGHSILFTEEVN